MTTAAALNNGLNLAYWLYRVHRPLFASLLGQVQRPTPNRFGALGDDASVISTDIGTSTTFDTGGISPDLISLPDPALADIGVAVPDISSDVGAAIGAANVPASGSISGGVAGGIAGALSSVGGFLASATGLTSLSNLATAYYKANTPQAATIATQIGRVQAGATPAPITYGYNAQGQLVPVLSQSGLNTPLTQSTLGSLVPSALARYALPIGLGLLAIWAFASRK